jgi:hypothetical protein
MASVYNLPAANAAQRCARAHIQTRFCLGNQQLSIHITRLHDYLKSSKNYCPRKLFSGSNFSPEKSLENQSCDRRKKVDYRRKKHKHFCKNSHAVYRFTPNEHRTAKRDLLAERTCLGKSVSVSLRKNGPYPFRSTV